MLLLAQSDKVVGWLTPVWVFSAGVLLGLVLVALLWGGLNLLSRVGWINTIYEHPSRRRYAGGVLSAVFLAALLAWGVSLGLWGDLRARVDGAMQNAILYLLFSAAISVALGFGLLAVVSKKRLTELRLLVRDGFLYWITVICVLLSGFAVLGYALSLGKMVGLSSFVEQPAGYLASLTRLPFTGQFERQLEIPVTGESSHGTTVAVGFRPSEARLLKCRTDEKLEIASQPITADLPLRMIWEVMPVADSDQFQEYYPQGDDSKFSGDEVQLLYIANRGAAPATVTVQWITEAEFPQVAVIPRVAAWLVALYLAFMIFCATMPKTSAIALSTFKTETSQPIFLLLLILGAIFAVASIYIPYNTFGEDIKMYKDSGLTLIRVLGIFLAVWAASKSVAEEIEGRTALTVLSKPVGRRQFILGKFTGISMAVGLLFIVLSVWFLIWLCYKPIYDGVETSVRDFDWTNGFREASKTIPGLALAYLESVVFVAISVAISTRLAILANFMICFAIYVLGHLTPLIVQSSEAVQAFEPVVLFGQVIAVVFPVLDHFDTQAAITGDADIPLSYLGWSTVYCVLYGTIAMLLALVLFEDRDLA